MNVILLGAPGAGKGTQAKMIADAYGIPHISTGDIFRANIKGGTELGVLAKSYIDRGELVPDDVTIAIVEDRIKQPDCKDGYLLDGFPRTIAQAEALAKVSAIDHVIDIEVGRDILLRRLTERRVCVGCGAPYALSTLSGAETCFKCGGKLIQREDDTEAVVKSRLEVYDRQTAPLIDYYGEKGVLRVIHSDNIIENTYAKIQGILGW